MAAPYIAWPEPLPQESASRRRIIVRSTRDSMQEANGTSGPQVVAVDGVGGPAGAGRRASSKERARQEAGRLMGPRRSPTHAAGQGAAGGSGAPASHLQTGSGAGTLRIGCKAAAIDGIGGR